MIIQYLHHMTHSWGNLVPILTAEMAITTDISYFFSKGLQAERLYADRNSLLFRSFKSHTFPSIPWFSSVFQSKKWFRFFFSTSCPPSPYLGLWPSRSKWCILIESIVYPTDAQLGCYKNVKIYINIYMRGAPTCFGFSQPSSGSSAKVISINNQLKYVVYRTSSV